MKYLIKKNRKTFNSGFTIIEVIVACTIITITVFTLMSAAQKGIELSNRALRQTQASTLIEEGAEVVKLIRDNDWNTIASLNLEVDYYLFFNPITNNWVFSTSSVPDSGFMPIYPIDSIFNRVVKISSVNRDSNDDISDTGTLDEKTKKITVTVSWVASGGSVNKSLVFYLADIFN